jgi:succinate---hydroxymethylglutarate CoA-transferase
MSLGRRLPPLHGLRVLDLSRILAGPFCSMLLGDMGAEVIKVEHHITGDDTRSWGPPFTDDGSESAYFLGVNRNKKSIAIDLKTPEGVKLIHELAATCDVLLENFVPGKAQELGFGYSTIAAINPKLVYLSLSGYGSSGPRANHLAYDVMVSAVGGLMGITGPKDGEPCKVGVAITDVCCGLVSQSAILAALIARYRDGLGQHIETSLLDTQVACLANVASAFLIGGVVTKPMGTAHQSIVPYQTFECADSRRLVVGALNNSQFVALCHALQLPLADDARFATNPQRVKHRDALIAILEDAFQSNTSHEWVRRLDEHHVPCAPINNVKDVFSDPQVLHNRRVIHVEHPTVGLLKMVAPPATFYGTPYVEPTLPPPRLGEHTESILRDILGYTPDQITALKETKVVRGL